MQLSASSSTSRAAAGTSGRGSLAIAVPHRAASQQQKRAVAACSGGAQEKLPIDVAPVVGERLSKWLATPFDLLAFPARAGAGALVTFPDRLQTLQTDVQRLVELVQDPRPVEEKQDVLRKELEETVLMFLERGTVVEQDVLNNLKAALPQEAASAIAELIPEPPNKTHSPSYATDPYSYADGGADADAPAAGGAPATTYGASDVLTSQIASEITEIRNAVGGLKSALEAIKNNGDAASAPMLRLRLREARDQLQRRLLEVSPSTAPDPSLSAATREAGILLDEVNALFFPA